MRESRIFQVQLDPPQAVSALLLQEAARRAPRRDRASGSGGGGDTLASPLQGTILRVAVEAGAAVEEGALVAVIEAMKMENEITAHKAGTIVELPISEGAPIAAGAPIATIKSPE